MREADFSDTIESSSAPSDASTSQTLANNQAAADVTSMLFSSATYRGVVVEIEVSRKTASSERRGFVTLRLVYDTTAASWVIVDVTEDNTGTDLGVTWTVTAAGQVKYATDNQSGASYAGTGKWKILRRYSA